MKVAKILDYLGWMFWWIVYLGIIDAFLWWILIKEDGVGFLSNLARSGQNVKEIILAIITYIGLALLAFGGFVLYTMIMLRVYMFFDGISAWFTHKMMKARNNLNEYKKKLEESK